MAKVICKHCGVEAESKCPVCRSVFITDESWHHHMMAVTRQGQGEYGQVNGSDELQLCFQYMVARTDEGEVQKATDEDYRKLVDRVWKTCNNLTQEQWRQVFCRHRWEFAPGHTSSIECGHGPKLEPVPA